MSEADRSRTMAAIRSKNTDIELILRRALWREGLRYRLNSCLPGRPDLVFPGPRIAVFCDGCFWHGCPRCRFIPKQNKRYWVDKIGGNRLRDLNVSEQLGEAGWTVLRYWGCEIRDSLATVVGEISQHVYGALDLDGAEKSM